MLVKGGIHSSQHGSCWSGHSSNIVGKLFSLNFFEKKSLSSSMGTKSACYSEYWDRLLTKKLKLSVARFTQILSESDKGSSRLLIWRGSTQSDLNCSPELHSNILSNRYGPYSSELMCSEAVTLQEDYSREEGDDGSDEWSTRLDENFDTAG